ncbi:protein phosphatase pp2a regulatory subunit b [Anaeramoeba flamelloides]|uniref:Protein phosphatase pp2a regulatory subunit b n=1 Tax=Anaeramoeba flamelloides TaxID=1746091 RepID=A0AAV7Z5X1_9EUKA|nr:protein phosphatase pp2a regulatory subunit b [Anaeramoeba flamelloides]
METTPFKWRVSQIFGDKSSIEKIAEQDKISALEFDSTDQTIKLWKIFSKEKELVTEFNKEREENEGINNPKDLLFPQTQVEEISKEAYNKRTYGNAHAYNINSISLSSDDEVFISSDELRINLWHLERTDKSFNIVDLKPEDLEQLSEVITCSQFHPNESNKFIYSLSKGVIHLGDLRQSAKCLNSVKVFEDEETSSNDSFFTEIVSNISDIKYSPCGRYILSRNYTTLKVWDVKMESKPLATLCVHDFSHSRLCELYENDFIFDKYAITGSYENYYYLFDWKNNKAMLIDGSKTTKNYSKFYETQNPNENSNNIFNKNNKLTYDTDNVDFSKKIFNISWNPYNPFIAVAATNILYLYTGKVGSKK